MSELLATNWALAPVGTMLPERRYGVGLGAVVRYAGASGDFSPVHYDPHAARAGDVDRMYAMGMLGAGWLAGLAVECFGAGSVRHFRVRFRGRLWLGDEVTCGGHLRERNQAGRTLLISLVLTGPDQTVIADAEATVTF